MLDKIVLSKDRKSAIIVYDTRSITISSDEDVLTLVTEIILEPTQVLIDKEQAVNDRFLSSLEVTEVTDIQLSFEGLL